MFAIEIPGRPALELEHLVLDFNGTLALDGQLLGGVAGRLKRLATHLSLHVLTGDTFGGAWEQLVGLPCTVTVLDFADQAMAKQRYVEQLFPGRTACIGNGHNDRLMLSCAALGIAVMQGEGLAVPTLLAADLVVPSILDALDLLLNPLRLTACLRQ